MAAPTPASAAPTAAVAAQPPAATQPTSVPAANRGTSNAPLLIPAVLPKPDFPSTNALVDDAYQAYPASPSNALPADPPGRGGDLNVLVALYRLPFTPLEQNPAWQEINKRLNANVKFSSVGTSDYPPKFATAIAGNDLPDTIHLLNGIKGAPNVPQFLTARCADLTPFLAGDAAKAYPNLASFSTDSWRNTGMVDNRIFAVPLPRNLTGLGGLFKNANVYDKEIGADYVPKNADDYRRILLQLNQPESGRWASAFSQGNALHAYYASLFGAPNNWRLDSSGKLVKDYETDEYRAAIGYLRDLAVAGVFNTDSLAKPAEFPAVLRRRQMDYGSRRHGHLGLVAAGSQSQSPGGLPNAATVCGGRRQTNRVCRAGLHRRHGTWASQPRAHQRDSRHSQLDGSTLRQRGVHPAGLWRAR